MDTQSQLAMCKLTGNTDIILYKRTKEGDNVEMSQEERMLLYTNNWYRWIIRSICISTKIPWTKCDHKHRGESMTLSVCISTPLPESRHATYTCRCKASMCIWCLLQYTYKCRTEHRQPTCPFSECDRSFTEEDIRYVPAVETTG